MILLAVTVLYSIGKLYITFFVIFCVMDMYTWNTHTGAVHSNTADSLFQCQPSRDHRNEVYTPNIPDLYFEPDNANSFSRGSNKNLSTSGKDRTFVFTLTERSCSGNLTAVQYCYKTEKGILEGMEVEDIFILLSMRKLSMSSTFVVENVLRVRNTPRNDVCLPHSGDKRYCCDTTTVIDGPHVSSLNNYAFGISTINDKTRPLRFHKDVTQYHVQHFRKNLGSSFTEGQSFSLTDPVNDQSLFLVRLFIGKHASMRHVHMRIQCVRSKE